MNGIGWYCKSKSHSTKIYENSHLLLLLLFEINLREKNAKNHYQSKDNYRNNNNNQFRNKYDNEQYDSMNNKSRYGGSGGVSGNGNNGNNRYDNNNKNYQRGIFIFWNKYFISEN